MVFAKEVYQQSFKQQLDCYKMFRAHGSSVSQKEMLQDLDLLAYQHFTQEQLRTKPSFEQAQRDLQGHFVRDQEQNQYPLCCDLDQFKKYGPGVYLTFKFLKFLLILMGILMVFPLTTLIIFIVKEQKFKDKNLQTMFETTTMSSLQQQSPAVIACNFIVLFVLTISIIGWRYKQTDYVLQCSQKTSLSSYFTVILTEIPNYFNERDLKRYLEEHYGKVHEIYTAKKYDKDLLRYKELQEVINDLKQQRQICLKGKAQGTQGISIDDTVQKFLLFQRQHRELCHALQHRHYEPFCTFITFETVYARNSLLEHHEINARERMLESSQNINKTIQQRPYKEQSLQFKACSMEPGGIIWENLSVSNKEKLLRCALITFLLIVFLFLTIIVFFIFAAAESSLYKDEHDYLSQDQIFNEDNPQAIRSHCIELLLSKFLSREQCKPYTGVYIGYLALYIALPLVVTLLKALFAALMQKLVILRRHKYQFYRIEWEISIITAFYFVKTGFIKWTIYQSFSIFGLKIQILKWFMPILKGVAKVIPIRPDRIKLLYDFDADWIAFSSHKLMLIALLSFNFSIILYHFSNIIRRKFRKWRAESQPTQKLLNEHLKGSQFDIQFIYAQILALFMFAMLYFSVMPMIYLLVYLSLFLLYWVAKYKFLRHDQKPHVYSHAINDLAIKIALIGLAINSIVSPIYYGGFREDGCNIFARIIHYWYYLINLIIIIIFYFWKVQILKLFYLIKNQIYQRLQIQHERQSYNTRINKLSTHNQQLNSYSMHNHKKYNQLLKVLYTLNRRQIHNLSYFAHQGIEELRRQAQEYDNSFKLFKKMYKELQKEYKQLVRSDYHKRNQHTIANFSEYLDIFKEIKDEVNKNIQEEEQCQLFYDSVRTRLKPPSAMRKAITFEEGTSQKESNKNTNRRTKNSKRSQLNSKRSIQREAPSSFYPEQTKSRAS